MHHLVPIKYGRMLSSPFAFLRGAAAVMAADLAATQVTGRSALLCGDAHLSNFGLFATPERKLVFDVNDFDEAFPGPWEWDVKRLASSAVVAGRESGLSERACRAAAESVAAAYCRAMKRLATMHALDVWYFDVEVDDVVDFFERRSAKGKRAAEKALAKARGKTQERSLQELTVIRDGQRRIVSAPPLLVPARELDPSLLGDRSQRGRWSPRLVEVAWSRYVSSLPDERRLLLQRFRLTDAALRVGGVGSVGTRCLIALLEGGGEDDGLILQLKEAGASVLEAYLPKTTSYADHPWRVVTAQRLMQAASDIFLGWHAGEPFDTGYYWRQLNDMKGSFDVTAMGASAFDAYVTVCSACLARAHARTGDASFISGYLGGGRRFTRAIGDFAVSYADQTERDHQALVAAVKSGRIAAQTGI